MKLVLSASMGLYCDHVTSIFGFYEVILGSIVIMKLESLATMRLYCNYEPSIIGSNDAIL